MALTKITSTNIQPGAIESSSLETSGATAGTYGAAAKIPVLSVNAQGIVYAITEADVAGVTDFTYNSSTEVLTISTADGSAFNADISTLASQTYVDTAVSNLVDTAPEALNTLNELAAALGDDANFATTVSTNLGNKVDKINITGATIGSGTAIPVITFNAQGQITSATTTAVAGIDTVTFSNGSLTISTGDGSDYVTDFDARYFTETEANANFLGINAKAADSDLLDGLNSTQFLRSDAADAISGTSSTGVLTTLTTTDGLAGTGAVLRLRAAGRGDGIADISIFSVANNTTDLFNVRNDGNVGIGTTSPGGPLDVTSSRSTAYSQTQDQRSLAHIIARNGSDAAGRFASISLVNGGGTQAEGSINLVQTGNYQGDLAFKLRTGANSVDWRERMRIKSNGNVGIGTDSPTAKLEISAGNSNLHLKAGDLSSYLGAGVFAKRGSGFTDERSFGGTTYTGVLHGIVGNDSSFATNTSAILFIKNVGNRGAIGHASGSDLIRADFNNSAGLIFNKEGRLGIKTSSPVSSLDINATDAMVIPVGTQAQRPTGYTGMMRFNSDTGQGELYDGNAWNSFGGYVSPYFYATANAASADNLYAYWSCSSTSATSSEAGTSTSASAALNGVTANSAYAGNGWDRGTTNTHFIRLDNMISGTAPTLTIAWWFVMTDATIHSTSDGAGMFWPDAGGSRSSQVMIGYDGGTRVLRAGGTGWVSDGAVAINPLNTGAYHHVVCVIDGTNCSYYINGQLEHNETASFVFGSSYMFSNYTEVGGNSNNHYHRGKIDEIAVWSRALSGTDVSSLYNSYSQGYSLIETLGVS